MKREFSLRVLLITDSRFADEHILSVVERAASSLPPGAFGVQLRDKWRDRTEARAFAHRLRELTARLAVPLIVNGDEALAIEVGADGLHTPAVAHETRCGLWRSVAAHSDSDVVAACRAGVDAVLVSPIFDTPGKSRPRGIAALTRARDIAAGRCAVVALGGVDAGSARACWEAGATGVAVIRALLGAGEPGAVARALFNSSEAAACS